MSDCHNLRRFIEAQEHTYESVVQELRCGEKRGHWMWYIFPQIEGLGFSTMSQTYAIASSKEARAFAAHPILGLRLRECTQHVVNVSGRSVEQIFGYPDDLKFRSCMTLFEYSATDNTLFAAALSKYFDGKADSLTLDIVNAAIE